MSMVLYLGKREGSEWSVCLDLILPGGVIVRRGRARKYQGASHRFSSLAKRSAFSVRKRALTEKAEHLACDKVRILANMKKS